MRGLWSVSVVLGLLVMGTGASTKRLEAVEADHYNALRVYMDAKAEKAYLKLKTREERDAWLKSQGLWDRFYKYDERTRGEILAGNVSRGWSPDMVQMAWGAPHGNERLAGRSAGRSTLLTYKFEVHGNGAHVVWHPKSKTAHTAVDLYRVELVVDDGAVVEINQVNGW